jgi:hypothetical protein
LNLKKRSFLSLNPQMKNKVTNLRKRRRISIEIQ